MLLLEFEVHTPLGPMRRMRGGRKKGGAADAGLKPVFSNPMEILMSDGLACGNVTS
jgi:hypothetical protein